MTDEDRVSVFVDDEIMGARKRDNRIKKLLLLGAGGSGKSTFFKQLQTIHGHGFIDKDRISFKSTFFKQLQTIHGHGFSDKDRISFKNHVYHQIIEQMKRIISRAEEFSEDYPE